MAVTEKRGKYGTINYTNDTREERREKVLKKRRASPKTKTLSCICDEVKNDTYGHDGSFFKNTKNGESRCKCAFIINSSGKSSKTKQYTSVVLAQRVKLND